MSLERTREVARLRMRTATLVAALALVVVGCGETSLPGAVRLDAVPEDTVLYVDALPVGPATSGTEVRVTSGSHVLEARDGAHVVAHAVVDVASGATAVVRLVPDVPTLATATAVAEPTAAALPIAPYGDPPGLGAPAPGDPLGLPGGSRTGAGLEPDVISGVVAAHRRDLNRCFETALRDDPSTESIRATVSLSIGPDGRVTSTNVGGGISRTLVACIARATARWTFPTSAGESVADFPIVFSAAR